MLRLSHSLPRLWPPLTPKLSRIRNLEQPWCLLPSWVSALSLDRVPDWSPELGHSNPLQRTLPQESHPRQGSQSLTLEPGAPTPISLNSAQTSNDTGSLDNPIKQPGHQYPGKEVGHCFSILHGKYVKGTFHLILWWLP